MQSFVKQNPEPGSDRLLREAEGLFLLERALSSAGITVPQIPTRIRVDRDRLELERIEMHPASREQMRSLGEGLARLHSQPGQAYGLERDNYIGLSPQRNGWSDNWGEFFADRRLAFQIARIESSEVRHRYDTHFKRCRDSLIAFLNRGVQIPSLLHGDLWSGNVLFDRQDVWLIDPAVYFGDAEIDLAMTEMFGGFSPAFYAAYEALRPRSPEYPLKRRIYNLYHYLNHYNLFDGSYLSGCEEGVSALDETLYR
ncbi:fructosamine kinase family protein [Marinobacterium sp. D7]|uniref:fructosamine kinase family protein n=1 Tax=Marinobacterium ramblicola TaxID=2849041 RepID=UPI001C2D6159|nr:fructosamine kinase family protein [Marinobacterium ramblicola]MBV1787954.1 fructosamine kinase family protein [Marinobacterium ramblicola]